jgi:hypothetical protein
LFLKQKEPLPEKWFYLLAGTTGFEPAISALTGPHVNRYTTPPVNFNFIIFGFQVKITNKDRGPEMEERD